MARALEPQSKGYRAKLSDCIITDANAGLNSGRFSTPYHHGYNCHACVVNCCSVTTMVVTKGVVRLASDPLRLNFLHLQEVSLLSTLDQFLTSMPLLSL